MTKSCSHSDVRCLNEYEFIRKYQCQVCGAVMMCACDERIGRKFLPHQLGEGAELDTGQKLRVTAGFQKNICRECRGFPAEAHPTSETFGRTTKIKRYYWRELAFRNFELLEQATGVTDVVVRSEPRWAEARAQAEEQALQEIKALHATNPKYMFSEKSQQEIIEEFGVRIIDLKGVFVRDPSQNRARLLDGREQVGAEEFVARHFERQGYSTLKLESRPFHALFGVYMWLLITDPGDPMGRMVMFGARDDYEAGRPCRQIWLSRPEDFGKPGYASRRAEAIDSHLSPEMLDRTELLWMFDYWRSYSADLRQYLWAHKERDVDIARKLVEILPPAAIVRILRHLVVSYWRNYLGWPDLLVYRESDQDLLFVEVKASGDKLSEDQKIWIRGNHESLHLPFAIAKIHRGVDPILCVAISDHPH